MLRKWDIIVFLFGGVSYGMIEIIWRQHTHWSMVILGGLCFSILYRLFNIMDNYSLLEKCVLGATVITCLEFLTGWVVNIIFGMGVWNYGRMPLNLFGQVCLLYSVMWGVLCIPINFISKGIKAYEKRR